MTLKVPLSITKNVKVVSVKYIFIDVVSFTHERTVESQSRIIFILNKIIRLALKKFNIKRNKVIILPTGDGMCIGCVDDKRYDLHLSIGLAIIDYLYLFNNDLDQMDKFQVRIGINQNEDNVVVDINDRNNLAGSGINIASRVMGFADGNQILVSSMVFDILGNRDKYNGKFKEFNGKAKHDLALKVFQYRDGRPGLNVDDPSAFVQTNPIANKKHAIYMCYCIRYRKYLSEESRLLNSYPGEIMLWFMAHDDLQKIQSTDIDKPLLHLFGEGKKSTDEMYAYYVGVDFGIQCEFHEFFHREFRAIQKYFETEGDFRFVNLGAVEHLKFKWPNTYKRLVGDAEKSPK